MFQPDKLGVQLWDVDDNVCCESGEYLLPVVFAIAIGLLVIVVAWILAYSVAGLGKFYNRMQVFQKWMNKIIELLFIAVGIYYDFTFYLVRPEKVRDSILNCLFYNPIILWFLISLIYIIFVVQNLKRWLIHLVTTYTCFMF